MGIGQIKTNRNIRLYLLYTVEFLLALLVMSSVFLYTGKSYIKYRDGVDQWFYTFCYLGKWLKEIFYNLFVEGTLSIPLWDMSIGYGTDIMTTLHYQGFTDPINVLAMFCSEQHMEIMFIIQQIFRIYLAGIFFIWYCLYHECEEKLF